MGYSPWGLKDLYTTEQLSTCACAHVRARKHTHTLLPAWEQAWIRPMADERWHQGESNYSGQCHSGPAKKALYNWVHLTIRTTDLFCRWHGNKFSWNQLNSTKIKITRLIHSLIQLSSVTQSCPTLCNPMNRSTPGLPVHHQLPELTQTCAHRVSDAIQPSHSLSFPSPPALNLSQPQGLFQWVSSLHQVARVLECQLQHQSFQWIFRTDLL